MREPIRPNAAALLVTRGGRYLMQHRDGGPGGRFPGWWSCFGGGIEPGETPAAGLRRELREEIGYDAPSARLFTEQAILFPFKEPRMERVMYFVVPIRESDIAGLRQREGAGMALRSPEDLAADPNVLPWDLAAVLMHASRKKLFGG